MGKTHEKKGKSIVEIIKKHAVVDQDSATLPDVGELRRKSLTMRPATARPHEVEGVDVAH